MTRVYDYLADIVKKLGEPTHHPEVVVVTHLLDDRPRFLAALEKLLPIQSIISIPYSEQQYVVERVSQRWSVERPSLDELVETDFVARRVEEHLSTRGSLIVLEIGGYLAGRADAIKERYSRRLLGCVEDTEHGHRLYESGVTHTPVVSVARGRVKRVEDRLIGDSIVYSVERCLRERNRILRGMMVGVLGYGKIGRSVCRALRGRGCRVGVFDIDPRAVAFAWANGFSVPSRATLLKTSELIVGATGNTCVEASDLEEIGPNCILASASSKQVEFDLKGFREHFSCTERDGHLVVNLRDGPRTVLEKGFPINFADRAVIGSALDLVQGALIAACWQIANGDVQRGVQSLRPELERLVAEQWLKCRLGRS